MRRDVSIPCSSIDNLRRLLHPCRTTIFYSALLLSFVALGFDLHNPHPSLKAAEGFFAVLALTTAFWNFGRKSRSFKPGLEYFLIAVFLTVVFQNWWSVPHLDADYFYFFIVLGCAALYGTADALILIAVMALLELPGSILVFRRPDEISYVAIGVKTALLTATAALVAHVANIQRRKILSLRDELQSARSTPLGFRLKDDVGLHPSVVTEASVSGADSLEESLHSILQRIKDYFRAHSVLLYQPYSQRGLTLRHWTSESQQVEASLVINIENTLLGHIFSRNISCNWNLDDPNSHVSHRDIPYYSDWQPIRHLAGSPLRAQDRTIGILVVDRTTSCPFTELEIIYLETFAIQLVEMIQMGKLYLEQLDRNLEYRLFYRAMSELAKSLATPEILEALADVCHGVVSYSQLAVALLDETGVNYEIALCRGMDKLKSLKVHNVGRTWISWVLSSDAGPLLLNDISSHSSRMPVIAPAEGRLLIRSVLMIPFESKGRKIGVLFLGSIHPDFFQNWHLRILKIICQQATANIENSLLHQRVEAEALTDGLTHLYNHRYFQERLKTEFSRARRSGGRLALLMVDIDHFKKVNDTYGHRIGDIILQQIAEILKRTIRSEDAIARYGGEEFVILLMESNRKGALRMADRLRMAVKQATFSADEHQIAVSVSIGSANFPEDVLEPWKLIEYADQALYVAKEQGRDRIVQYHTLSHEPVS